MEQTSVYGVVYDKKKRTRKSQRSNFLTVMSYAGDILLLESGFEPGLESGLEPGLESELESRTRSKKCENTGNCHYPMFLFPKTLRTLNVLLLAN
jgi:hypothetical protein